MSFSISSIGPAAVTPVTPLDAGSKSDKGFGSVLAEAMHTVGDLHDTAAKGVENFLSGEGDDLHKTILTSQRAELAMELFLQVRNKVVQAYQEVMRMQV